jgi:glycosyltransferase involved in cell wall biosynthesis
MSRWLEGFLYARADHILVNSPAYRDYLINKGVESQKISFISNGVATESFNGNLSREVIRGELGIDGKFAVTYAGALGLANDIPMILRAAERLQENDRIRFLLVGDGKERHNLETTAQQMNLKNVIFTGPRPKADMPGILAASNACTATLQNIPMFSTTYPNKVFDYMAAGKPTILAIDGVIREVIEASRGGIFVPPGDDEAFAKAVQELEQDGPKTIEMGKAAQQYVAKHFDRKDQAKQFIELVEKLTQ